MPQPPWHVLAPTLLEPAAFAKADPYLRMADATAFCDHLATPPAADTSIPVSVELKPGRPRPAIAGMAVPRAYPAPARYFTARADAAAISALLVHADVARVQMAEGALPQRSRPLPRTPWSLASLGSVPPSSRTPSKLLLGVIDAGCPFAHAELRAPDGLSTRVVRYWNQDPGLGKVPESMGYGSELTDAELNALIARATDALGQVDEHACYLMAGADQALFRASHGAHALGLLAGARRYGGSPPGCSFAVASPPGDPAVASADIAFVQLPHKLLEASFPLAVQHHVMDALRYLLEIGHERKVSRIVVSFAFESWVGPHDGSTWLEQAVQDLMAAEAEQDAPVDLKVVFVAGNAGARGVREGGASRRAVHRRLDDGPADPPSTGRQASLTWHVLPDDQMLTYLELWVPRAGGALADLRVEITPPGQPTLPSLGWGDAVAWPMPSRPGLCVVMDQSRTLGTSEADVVIVRISPTQVFDARQGAAPHGEWQARLTSGSALDSIHAYIGRATENLGAPHRGRQATLTRRDAAQRLADRQGTLNGYANHPAAIVATACVGRACVQRGPRSRLQPFHAAPYAGIGPSRDGGRQGPTFGVAFEHGVYHLGLRGIGNRSAGTFRLIGTSVAGPLGARLLLDHAFCDPTRPAPPGPAAAREVGGCEFDPTP